MQCTFKQCAIVPPETNVIRILSINSSSFAPGFGRKTTVRVVTSTRSRPIFSLFVSHEHLDFCVSSFPPRISCWTTRFGNSVWKHLSASSNRGEKSSSFSSSFLFLLTLLLRAKSSTASSEAATLLSKAKVVFALVVVTTPR